MELKPCPFCGGEAELSESTSGLPFFSIWCKNEDCFAGAIKVRDFDKERLVKSWNTRHETTCKAELMPYMPGCYEGYWCSVCHCIDFESDEPNYCPHCGAKVVDDDE